MEYLQYWSDLTPDQLDEYGSFKPCYKWNTFNTFRNDMTEDEIRYMVLNLVISGIPSIL